MIKKLIKIGEKLEALKVAPNCFSQKCKEVLDDLENSLILEDFSVEIARWMLKFTLPKQLNVYNTFGQPPVTIFRNDDFVIDIYFWMHADTSIHSHAFSGAFKVLYGQSLHEEFKTEQKESFSHDSCLNQLTREKTQILKAGDCREIIRGEQFIHRVVHLSAPTITLCIRTVADLNTPQWHHFDNGLSILKKELDESLFKKIFYGDYLFHIDQENGEKFTEDFILKLDISDVMNFYEQLTVDTMGISDDYQERVYNIMMSRLADQPWIDLYESYCERIQHYQQDHSYNEKEKIEYHGRFYDYPKKEIDKLLNDID